MKPYYYVRVTLNNALFADTDAVDGVELAEAIGKDSAAKAVYEVLYGSGTYQETELNTDTKERWHVTVTTWEWTEA